MAAAKKKITLKLFIDKEKNRVVLAESDKDFVDILFSFLTLPLGAIIRILGKQSYIGCLDRLYESVENLGTDYLQAEACRSMLLRPINAAEELCHKLAIEVDDAMPTGFCCTNLRDSGCPWWSRVPNTRCKCGLMMDWQFTLPATAFKEEEGLFVRRAMMFMISDDLCVMPASTKGGKFLLNKLGVSSGTVLEEQMVDIGRDEVLNLLKCSLQSRTALTEVFLQNSGSHVYNLEDADEFYLQVKKEVKIEPVNINVKLFLSKTDKRVLYGEVGDDFVNLLFSFLVLPLGSIVKYLSGNSYVGSLDNLYRSVEELKVGECMISEERKSMLLLPKLASYFGFDNRLLHVTEKAPYVLNFKSFNNSQNVYFGRAPPQYCFGSSRGIVELNLIDSKNLESTKKSGGIYVKEQVKFMVTDEMVVEPLSFTAITSAVSPLKKSIFDVEEKQVSLEEIEVMALLRATLINRSALSSAFSQLEKRRLRKRY